MNSVKLIGRLTKDPESGYTQQGTAVTKFTLAVDRRKKEDGADFIRITTWSKTAENCARYLSKGRQVAVDGRIQTGSYKDRDGKMVYTTDVVANEVEFLGKSEERSEPTDDYIDGWATSGEGVPF